MASYEPYPADSAARQSAAPDGTPQQGPRPPSVRYAEWLVWAKIALALVAGVVTLLLLDSIVDDAIARADLQGSAAPAPDMVRTIAMGGAIAGMVIGLAVMGTMAFFLHRGANWARITYTVLVSLGLATGLLGLLGSSATQPAVLTVFSVLGMVLTVAVLVLLWRKESTAWFTSR